MDYPQGLRKTKSRQVVWEILNHAGKPLSARQIAEQATKKTGASRQKDGEDAPIWLSSVYRALDAFEKEHVISKTVLSGSNEAIYTIAGSGHHHYAICMNCKSRTELKHCPFAEAEALDTKDSDFMVVGHTVEVFGYCKDCQKKMAEGDHQNRK